MKKTLAAVAVLGAFAGSALAADVTLYGRLDTGLHVNDFEKTTNGAVTDEGTDWSMESGNAATSRIGVKGSEQISEDLTVGFVLEKKLLSDTGAEAAAGFDRESLIFAKTNYGTIYAGKVGSLWSDGGATNFWASNYVAFGTGNSVATGTGFMVSQGRVGNRLSYVSPEFAGFKAYAEYSFGDEGAENTSGTNRPAALGLKYANGAFGAGLVVTYNNEKSWLAKTNAEDGYVGNDAYHKPGKDARHSEQEDEYTINLGTNYDFGVANVMLAGQYYKNADKVGAFSDVGNFSKKNEYGQKVALLDGADELEGYSVTLGATVPAWGGTWTLGVAYGDGEDKGASGIEFEGYNVAAMYEYKLSKQTMVYAGAGYTKVEAEDAANKYEVEGYNAMAGMCYYF